MESGLMLLPDRHILLFVPKGVRSGLIEAFTVGRNVSVRFVRGSGTRAFNLTVRWMNQRGARVNMIISSLLVTRISTHIIVRMQRRWRRAQQERAMRRMVVGMALHARLGAASPLRRLDLDALRLIVREL